MKEKTEEEKRILLLLKLDAHALYRRLTEWQGQYLSTFFVKRTRDHFREVFKTRYDTASIEILKHCGQEVIITLDQYYTEIERLKWFFGHTEDLPGQIEDKLIRDFKKLRNILNTLDLYIEAEIQNHSEDLIKSGMKVNSDKIDQEMPQIAQTIDLNEVPSFEVSDGFGNPPEESEKLDTQVFSSEENPDN